MAEKTENPVALAGADRGDVKVLGSNDDIDSATATTRERQARLKFYAVSLPVALVIAGHAFDLGRRRA